MIAALRMYGMPHARPAHDRYWQAIRNALGFGPADLNRTGELWDQWLSPKLLLAQTCGLPFRAYLHDKVKLVGTPDYGVPGCPPGHYCSVFVVRTETSASGLAGFDRPWLAYNDPLSQSGWAAAAAHFRTLGVAFRTGPQTGAHWASARAVAEGRADVAALDAVTWKMLQREDPGLASQLRVMDQTKPTPGLPYITAITHEAKTIAQAVTRAICNLNDDDRETLQLRALVHLPAEAYTALPMPVPAG